MASNTINNSLKTGGVVVLLNIHLSEEFIPILQNKIEKINDPANLSDTNINFRLIMTTSPSKSIPLNILINSMKITNEPANGIKNNMIRVW